MIISRDYFQHITLLGVKALTQPERIELDRLITSLSRGKLSVSTTISEDFWNAIKIKIQMAEQKPPSHLFTRLWKGFLNLMGWRISSHNLFHRIENLPVSAPSPAAIDFSSMAIEKLKNAAFLLESNLQAGHIEKLRELLTRNPKLAKSIFDAPEYFFEDLENPAIEIMQGLIRGFQCPITPIHLKGKENLLFAGCVVDGLSPNKDVEVVINLDRSRLNLEDQASFRFDLYDAEAEHLARHGQTVEGIQEELEKAFDTAIKNISDGKKVLVHCMEGKNRTGILVSMVIAYFNNSSFEGAFSIFMEARGSHLGANPTGMYRKLAKTILQKRMRIS